MFTLGDAFEVLVLALLVIPAWCLPSSAWNTIARALAAVTNALARRPVPALPDDLAHALGRPIEGNEATRIRGSMQIAYFEERLHVLAAYPPRRWQPSIHIEGRQNVDAALASGRGAILWVNEFVGSDLVAKAAAHQAGYAPSHLTRPEHGYSNTRLGMRLLNPIQTRAEDRFLAERVTMRSETGVAALRTLARKLSDNGVVTITVGADAVRKHSTRFLGGYLTVGTGPITLALSSGAPLLPVITLHRGAGQFTVIIAPDVVPRDARGRDEAVTAAQQALGDVLRRYILEEPQLWRGWKTIFTEAEPAAEAH